MAVVATLNDAVLEGSEPEIIEIAHLVPEFDAAADWKTYSRNLLFSAMDAQVNPDGGHAEASPGYMGQIISALLDTYCITCHNQRLRTAGLALDGLDVMKVDGAADVGLIQRASS